MNRHPILTPAQMLDMQADLITRLSDNNSLLREVIKTTLQYGSESSGVDKGKGEASAIAMTENLAVTAHVAEAFYITNDLAAEVVRRSRDEQYMPGIRQFDRNDAPTRSRRRSGGPTRCGWWWRSGTCSTRRFRW